MATATRKRLSVDELIAAHQAELVELDETIAQAQQAIEDAYRFQASGSADNQFLKGRPGFEAKAKRAKAQERKQDVERILVHLAERRAREEAERAVETLRQRTRELGPLTERIENAWRHVADVFAQLGPAYAELRDAALAHEVHRRSVTDSGLLAEANDRGAVDAWNTASVMPLTPLPHDLGQMILLAARGSIGDLTRGDGETPLGALFTKLGEHNRSLDVRDVDVARSDYNIASLYAADAESRVRLELAANPPAPGPEELEARARREAEEERLYALREHRQQQRRQVERNRQEFNFGRPAPPTPSPEAIMADEAERQRRELRQAGMLA